MQNRQKVKNVFIADNMVAYVENPKDPQESYEN